MVSSRIAQIWFKIQWFKMRSTTTSVTDLAQYYIILSAKLIATKHSSEDIGNNDAISEHFTSDSLTNLFISHHDTPRPSSPVVRVCKYQKYYLAPQSCGGHLNNIKQTEFNFQFTPHSADSMFSWMSNGDRYLWRGYHFGWGGSWRADAFIPIQISATCGARNMKISTSHFSLIT